MMGSKMVRCEDIGDNRVASLGSSHYYMSKCNHNRLIFVRDGLAIHVSKFEEGQLREILGELK